MVGWVVEVVGWVRLIGEILQCVVEHEAEVEKAKD